MVCSVFNPECLVEHPNLCGRCYQCKEHCRKLGICPEFFSWSGKMEDTAVWRECGEGRRKNPEKQKIKIGLIKLFLTKWRQLCRKI